MKKISVKISIPIIILVFLTVVALITMSLFYANNLVNLQVDKRVESEVDLFYDNLKDLEDKAIGIASVFASSNLTIESYKIYNQEEQSDSAYNLCKSEFETINKSMILSGNNEFRIHFHTKKYHSFFRSWTDKRGDDLSSFRHTIKMCIDEKIPVKGIEVGRGGLVIRGVMPILDQDKNVLGSVENYVDITELINRLTQNDHQDEFSIFLDTKYASLSDDKISTNVNSKSKQIGEFVQVNSTSEFFNISNIKIEDIKSGFVKQYTYKRNGFLYSVNPLKDFSGKTIGVFVYQLDLNNSISQIRELFIISILVGIAVIVFMILVIGIFAKFVIENPLRDVEKSLQKIEKGDLTEELNVTRKDEIGNLQNYSQIMIKKLREIVSTMQDVSIQVLNNSSNLEQSAQVVSQNSQEQASTSEELSATIEQITSSVEQNSNFANQSELNAKETIARFIEGSVHVKKAINLMQIINEQIEVVREIAYKTNLLSINAAVEAAHAGEAGKGFAVVANEVKKLAQRSENAATDIEKLSKQSYEISNKIEVLFNEITPKIKNIEEQIHEIAYASNEQKQSVNQMQNSIMEFSNSILQNTNAVDNVLDNANQLNAQISDLEQIVKYFKVS